ncbi:MAG: WD40 repeat domain-containing protein [Sedimentitalea sp.]
MVLRALFLWLLLGSAAVAQSQAERMAVLMSKDFARQSEEALLRGDRANALIYALQALPEAPRDGDMKTYEDGYRALLHAMVSRSIRVPIQGLVKAAISPSGHRIATISTRGSVPSEPGEPLKLWDTRTNALIATLMPLSAGANDTYDAAAPVFSADGRFLVQAASTTGEVLIFDPQTGGLLRRIAAYPPSARYIHTAFSPDGSRLVTRNTKPNQLDLWDPATGARLATHAPGARGCRFQVIEGGTGSDILVAETGSPGLCPPQRNLLYRLGGDGSFTPLIDLSSLAPFQVGPFASTNTGAPRLLLNSERGGMVIDTNGQMVANLPVSLRETGFFVFGRDGTALMAPNEYGDGRLKMVDFTGAPLTPLPEDGLGLLHAVFSTQGLLLGNTLGLNSQYTGKDLPRNAALYQFVWTNLPAHIRDQVSADRVQRP